MPIPAFCSRLPSGQSLQPANKTLRRLSPVDEVAELMEVLENLPDSDPLKDNPAYKAVKKRGYVRVPRIVPITRPEQVGGFDASDFSPETIQKRAAEGYAQTKHALRETMH